MAELAGNSALLYRTTEALKAYGTTPEMTSKNGEVEGS